MKNIKRFMLPAVLASALMFAACGSEEDDAAEVEAETEEVAEVEEETEEVAEVEEEDENVEDVEEEEVDKYEGYEHDLPLLIHPEDDAHIVGSSDVYAAVKVAEDLAEAENLSRLKAYKRLIEPLDTDQHDTYNAETANEAIEITGPENWAHAAARYITTEHPELNKDDDFREMVTILNDPEQGAFKVHTAASGVGTYLKFYE